MKRGLSIFCGEAIPVHFSGRFMSPYEQDGLSQKKRNSLGNIKRNSRVQLCNFSLFTEEDGETAGVSCMAGKKKIIWDN